MRHGDNASFAVLTLSEIPPEITLDALGLPTAFAITAGLVQAFVAIVFLRFRSDRADWGLGWFGCAFGLAALLNLSAPLSFLVIRGGLSSGLGLLGLVVGISIMCTLVVGVRRYTGVASVRVGATFGVVWLVYLCTVGFRQVLAVDPALIGNAVTALIFVYLGWRFWRAHQLERDAGHWIAAAMIALYPPLIAIGWWWGLDQIALRYWSAVPFSLAGLGVMSATMGRLRGELVRLNATLENRVAQRTEALQDMLTSLESFSSMVSHDVKGTLGGISGLSKVALDALASGDDAKARRLFEAIGREADQMVDVVSDLLTLARASQSEVHTRSVSLAELVHEVRQSLVIQYGESVCQCIHHGQLPNVPADPGLLRQVLVNLLSNALKFSRHVDAPSVEVSAHPDATGSGYVISVSDNGAGFDPGSAGELFQPFRRLDRSGRFEGNGVGLTIVRRIVERHGGRVWAEGRLGRGSTFSFWLPCA